MPWSLPSLRRAGLSGGALLFTLAALAVLLFPPDGSARADEARGRVVGRITGATAPDMAAGQTVVLLQYTLDEEGKPKGGPIAEQQSDGEGRYAFAEVPLVAKAVYQLGTRIGEKVVSSRPFTFPDGEREVALNISLQQRSDDAGELFIGQALVAVEPRVGQAFITEVVHLENPTGNEIDLTANPLELRLPAAAADLEMVRQEQKEGRFQRAEDRLLIYGLVAPGTGTVAFRYRVGVPWGRISLEKEYPFQVKEFVVLAPQGGLDVNGAGLAPRSTQSVGQAVYDAWGRSDLPAGLAVRVSVTGMPLKQEVYLWTLPAFLVLMGAAVLVFLRRRLNEAKG